MASSIFFGGRRINVPQAVSKVDASALAATSPAAVGIVALIGTAEGGKPLDASDAQDLTSASAALDRYRSGNLRTASQFVFQPSADPDVPGGAQRLVPVKVNPSTQSTATLQDANAIDSVVVKSRDYGLFTNQINVAVASGTNQGKKVTVVFEDESEIFDDVGGATVFSLLYAPGSNGYATALATLNATLFKVVSTKAATGLVTERTANIPAPGPVRIVSSDAGDVTQTVTIYGLNGTTAVRETLTLNGLTNVNGSQSFTKVLGVEKSAATIGTITVSDQVIPTALFTLAPGTLTRGIAKLTNCHAAGAITSITIDALAAVDGAIFGRNASGSAVGERYDFTTSLSQAGSQVFSRLDVIALGDIAAARTVTITVDAVSHLHASYATIQRLADRLNALSGFTANVITTAGSTYRVANLDYITAQSVLTAYNFKGDLQAVLDKLNGSSAYVTATRAVGGLIGPANTAATFLAGAIEGVATITQWQQAFTALAKRRVNIIVCLTEDPAVHALLLAHLIERAGKLRSEANGYVGIGTAAGLGETKANIKAQIQAIASRHLCAISQQIERFDPDTGEATFYPPWMGAVIAAGMQAGSVIAEPLTRKQPTCTDIANDATWDVTEDVEEMIDAGLMMLEKVDGLGIRWIRSITTHLADDKLAFTEMSSNESINTSVYNLRLAIEPRIGKRGLAKSAATIKGLASDELDRQVRDEIIFAWRALTVEQIGDVFPTSVEIAAVDPINFVPITVHLATSSSAAA